MDDQIRFTHDHMWVRLEEDNCAVVGITEEAVRTIQDFNRINFPSEGDVLSKDDVLGAILVDKKPLFTLVCPISGEVLDVNDDIEDATDVLLEGNYDEGWLVRLLIQTPKELDDLLTWEEYEEYVTDGVGFDDDDEDEDYDEDDDRDDDDYYDDDDDDEYDY